MKNEGVLLPNQVVVAVRYSELGEMMGLSDGLRVVDVEQPFGLAGACLVKVESDDSSKMRDIGDNREGGCLTFIGVGYGRESGLFMNGRNRGRG